MYFHVFFCPQLIGDLTDPLYTLMWLHWMILKMFLISWKTIKLDFAFPWVTYEFQVETLEKRFITRNPCVHEVKTKAVFLLTLGKLMFFTSPLPLIVNISRNILNYVERWEILNMMIYSNIQIFARTVFKQIQ